MAVTLNSRASLAVQVLSTARDLIATPDKWCQFHLGLTADGRDTTGATPDTVKRCAVGALNAAAKILKCNRATAWHALTRVLLKNRSRGIAEFNNTHTHGEVIALFSAAIASERKAA